MPYLFAILMMLCIGLGISNIINRDSAVMYLLGIGNLIIAGYWLVRFFVATGLIVG